MPPPKGAKNILQAPGDYTTTETVHNDTYEAISPLQFNLAGRAVFITGASKGVGHQLALAYARAGVSYIGIGARSSLQSNVEEIKRAAAEANRSEPKVVTFALDVRDGESVAAAAAGMEREFGRLDIVVNNAGVLGGMTRIGDSSPDVWWDTMDVNARGPYLVSRASLPLLLRTQDGLKTLVTVSSVGAISVAPGVSAYMIAKTASVRLMQFVAAEYADQGIVAFAVHPGNMLTDIAGNPEDMDPDMRALFTESPPLPGETIPFLTAEKRDWLSGRYVNCTWDMPQLLARKEEIVSGDKLKLKLDVPSPFDPQSG